MLDFLKDIILTVVGYLRADWYILLAGVLIAVVLKVYVDTNKFKNYLDKNAKVSILGSIGFGAFTPLCACGTMAVILSMFFTSMPWGPVMAFLISSPLTSPSEYMFETAFLGTKFATMVVVSSILLGLLAGGLAHLLDKKTNFFKGQFRLSNEKPGKNCCPKVQQGTESSCCADTKLTKSKYLCCTDSKSLVAEKKDSNTGTVVSSYPISRKPVKAVVKPGTVQADCCSKGKSLAQRLKLGELLNEFWEIGCKKVLLYFVIFIAVGRIVELAIPKEWIMALFSGDKPHSVVLGASIGLPLYVSGPASLPLLKSFMAAGAGQGALMAFLITGKATGLPVIAGLSTMLKKRALAFYVIFIYLGGIACGYLYQLALNLHL